MYTGVEVRGFALSMLMLLSYHQKGCIPLTTVSYIHLIVFKMLFETENLSITKPPQANFSEPNQNPPVRRRQERDSR